MAEEIEANQLDYWSALTEYRNRDLKTARDKLYALNRRGLRGEARLTFWKEILFDWCFHNTGLLTDRFWYLVRGGSTTL